MSERNKIMLKLCLFYGCRISELRLAKKQHFDFEDGVWTVPPENHKTGAKTQRAILRPIVAEIVPILKRVISLAEGDYLFQAKKMHQWDRETISAYLQICGCLNRHG